MQVQRIYTSKSAKKTHHPTSKTNQISNKLNKQMMLSTRYLVNYRSVGVFAVTITALMYVSASSWYYKYNTGVTNTFDYFRTRVQQKQCLENKCVTYNH